VSSTGTPTARDPRGTVLVIALGVAAIAILLWLTSGERERNLRQSAVGFDALAIWLRDSGQPARVASGWERIDPADVWLRILPLYDVDLDARRSQPDNEKAILAHQSEVDIRLEELREKIWYLPTLVVLPKWRSGMRLTGVAHPDLLNDEGAVEELVGELLGTPGEFVPPTGDFGTFTSSFGDGSLQATLYLPRALKGSGCDPLIGTAEAMILGFCMLEVPTDDQPNYDNSFWLLTDPDLMNAHGLRLGDNADIATETVAYLASGELAVIDYMTSVWSNRRSNNAERSWADLLRFFGPPFGVLWAGLAATVALVLWRATVRYGAPLHRTTGRRASKDVSVEATARILRLSGHDDELVSALVRQRLDLAAGELMGPHFRADTDALTRMVDWIRPRNAELAEALARSADAQDGEDPLQRLDDFETTLAQVLNDFGRTPRPG